MVRFATAALMVVVCAWGPARALAQTQQTEARALFERGMEHAASEQWVQALEAFEASVQRYDRPSTHLNIASVMLRLGRHIDARDNMRALLSREDLSADDRERADALLTRAVDGIRTVALRVEPADASVRVDGALVTGEGSERALELDPGTHRLELSAQGYAPQTRELSVTVRDVEVSLRPVPATLSVRSSVDDATIAIDGEVAGAGAVELEVSPGRHELVVTAEAHDRYERWLTLSAGQRLDVVASLSRSEAGDLLADPWFWGIGSAVVLIAAGLTIGLALGLPSGPEYDGGTLDDVLMPR